MNFDQIFPLVKETFAVKLNLFSPKKKYDFTRDCDGVSIQKTFNQAVKKFNSDTKREMDGACITEYEIRENTIFLGLEIYKGAYKKIKNMIGNAFSKTLYTKYGWKKLTNKKLFKVEAKQLEDIKISKYSGGIRVVTSEKTEEKSDKKLEETKTAKKEETKKPEKKEFKKISFKSGLKKKEK